MTKPVIAIGDVNVDMVIQLPDRSVQPVDLSRSEPQVTGGGTVANTATALARLGVPVVFAGTVGDDGFGRWLRDDFAREGVRTDGLRLLDDRFTPTVIAMVEPDGERYLVIWPTWDGAHHFLQSKHLDRAQIADACWLHSTGICLRRSPARDTILEAMQIARAAGVPVSFDLNLRVELWGLDDELRGYLARVFELCDVILGSGTEELIPLTGAESVEAAARQLAGERRAVIARMGADGVLATIPGQEGLIYAPAFPTEVCSTVGAGDAFNGGFIAARSAGLGMQEALQWGNATAALKIRHPGTRDLPTRAEVEALIKSSGRA